MSTDNLTTTQAILNIAQDSDLLPERKIELIDNHLASFAGKAFWARFIAMMHTDVTLTMSITVSETNLITVSILPSKTTVDDDQESFTPLTISGTIEEFGAEFFAAASTRITQAVSVIVNDSKKIEEDDEQPEPKRTAKKKATAKPEKQAAAEKVKKDPEPAPAPAPPATPSLFDPALI
jgi:PRTRC genetic system protein E